MKIEYLEIENFKSFKKERIEFNEFNVFIGANASGKSNTVEILKFIANIVEFGLENTISLHGGLTNILNANIGKEEPLKIKFKLSYLDERIITGSEKKFRVILDSLLFDIEIRSKRRGEGYIIQKDIVEAKYYQIIQENPKDIDFEIIHEKYLINIISKFKKDMDKSENYTDKKDLSENYLFRFSLINDILKDSKNKNELILNEYRWLTFPAISQKNIFKIYDFDPKLMKKASSQREMKNLEEDGSNIAYILREIIRSSKNKSKLINLMSDLLPFIDQIRIENNFDKSISYKIKEKFSNKSYYANFLSDGTVNLLALIVVLFFEDQSGIVVIEEPERNIHPKLMDKIVEMANITSKKKQLIITTHNPEIIKYSKIENVRFVKRNEEGYTRIISPKEIQSVVKFLSDEIGLEDLFLKDLIDN